MDPPRDPPSNACESTASFESFCMRHPKLEMIHLHWVDLTGVLKARVVPKDRCVEVAKENGSFGGGAWPNIGPLGDFSGTRTPANVTILHPDWSSLRSMGDLHASVMCNSWDERTGDPGREGGLGLDLCPRHALQTLEGILNTQQSLKLLVGVEIEFYLVDRVPGATVPQTRSRTEYKYNSLASSVRGWPEDILTACVLRLQESGLKVEHWHAECGAQQFEIALRPMGVLEAADACVLAKELIARMTESHGMMAIFNPKPFEAAPSSGLHVHVSFADAEALEVARSVHKSRAFVAGVLRRQRLLCAYAMTTHGSYERLCEWVLGDWICWGTENRDAPVRRINDLHWEFRAIDSMANMYLALTAYLGAGLLGLKQNEALVAGDWRDFQSRLDSSTRVRLGISELLPKTLQEAVSLICQDDLIGLNTVISPGLLELYRVVKCSEQVEMSRMTPDGRAALLFHAR